jgi:Mannose-1-phosphate guanylyltransferase
MAGGVGSRFWPLSRRERPKQFLDIVGTGETLIQQTYRRFKKSCPAKNIFVVTNSEHKEIVIDNWGLIHRVYLQSLFAETLLHVLPMVHSGS